MKKWFALLLVTATLIAAALPAMAASASIKKTEYEGSGYVDVDFRSRVQYKSAKVTVRDSSGKTYKANITEKDGDDLTFKASGISSGKTYTYIISGIRAGSSGSYGSVSGTFKTPGSSSGSGSTAKKLSIKSLDYDAGDRELEIEFSAKVQYNNLRVRVTDPTGAKSYTVRILEKDNDSIDIRVSGLRSGQKYTVKVAGVRQGSSGSYGGVSKSFTVR